MSTQTLTVANFFKYVNMRPNLILNTLPFYARASEYLFVSRNTFFSQNHTKEFIKIHENVFFLLFLFLMAYKRRNGCNFFSTKPFVKLTGFACYKIEMALHKCIGLNCKNQISNVKFIDVLIAAVFVAPI